jgi:hypothetical protein
MILCWLVEALSNRYTVSPDAISYLDIATACMKGQWTAAVNAYWSPGYPVLLSILFSVFHPHGLRELLVVKLFNCFILMIALYCLEYFLQGLLEFMRRDGKDRVGDALPAWSLRASGYTLFLWITLYLMPPSVMTPDALVFAWILVAAGIAVRIATGADGWLRFALLGIVLALGYLTKAVMFPLAFVFLAALLFSIGNPQRMAPRVALALVLFSVVSAPFALLISRNKGRFTFGDSGRIAYAEYVDGIPRGVHWRGEPPASGQPKHPTRKILEMPPVYEYSSPITGTYPPWSDPSYWYDGVRPHFDLKGQLVALWHTLDSYFELSTQLGSVVAGLVVLLLWGNRTGDFLERFWTLAFLWFPALVGFAMYALIFVDGRYVAGFVLLLWAAIFSAIRIPPAESGNTVIRCVTLAIVLVLGVQIAWSAGHSVLRLASFRASGDQAVADELIHEGIAPGDKVAFVGFALMDHYWARLAGVSIVAEVPQEGTFWEAGPGLKTQVLSLFAKSGAKAVVTRDVPPLFSADGWKRVPDTAYFVLSLSGLQ